MASDPVLTTLKHLWLHLEPLHLPMALMGGLSIAVWKHPRATRDVDLLINPGTLDANVILQALEKAGFRRKRPQPVLQVGTNRFLQLTYEAPGTFLDIQADLLFADSVYQKQALARRVSTRLPDLDTEIFVLSCEDLILHKLLAGRILDKADVVALLRANLKRLDMTYLLKWLDQLDLSAAWREVWVEAFPGSEPPGA